MYRNSDKLFDGWHKDNQYLCIKKYAKKNIPRVVISYVLSIQFEVKYSISDNLIKSFQL